MHSHTPPNLPRTQDGPIGNELKTDAGQLSKIKSGETGTDKFNSFKVNKTELPVPRLDRSNGLGRLGIDALQKTTFAGIHDAEMKEIEQKWERKYQ